MKSYDRYGEYVRHRNANQGVRTSTATGLSVGSLLLGAGVGAAVALLFAPKSGSEVRNTIAGRLNDAKDAVTTQASSLRDKGSDLVNSAKDKVTPMLRKASDTASNAAGKAGDTAQDVAQNAQNALP